MDQNESEYGSMLFCYIHVTVVAIVMYGIGSVLGCSARALMNHFWSHHACSLTIKEAIQSMLGSTYTLTDPSREKTTICICENTHADQLCSECT